MMGRPPLRTRRPGLPLVAPALALAALFVAPWAHAQTEEPSAVPRLAPTPAPTAAAPGAIAPPPDAPPAQSAVQPIALDARATVERDRTSDRLLEEGWRQRSAGNLDAAAQAFERARAAGADPQQVSMELGYIALARGRRTEAYRHFTDASRGPDPGRTSQARAELRVLPHYFSLDVYFEAWSWARTHGAPSANLVPTLRLRGMWRPSLDFDLNFYVYAQGTRDVASMGNGTVALSRIFADNHLLLGAGVLLRLWSGRVGFYAQGGPAINLLPDGSPLVLPDVRVVGMLTVQTEACRPTARGVAALLGFCLEGYDELVYVSRFNHDIVNMARGRAGYTLLVTGPVAWQPILESRVLVSRNGDYWNNLGEFGGGHRWRLLRPFVIDLLLSVNSGWYFGRSGADPVPTPASYTELRAFLNTSFTF